MRTRVDVLELMLQQRGRLDDWYDPYCVADLSGRTLLDHAINHPDGIPRKRQPIHAKIITLLLEAGLLPSQLILNPKLRRRQQPPQLEKAGP